MKNMMSRTRPHQNQSSNVERIDRRVDVIVVFCSPRRSLRDGFTLPTVVDTKGTP